MSSFEKIEKEFKEVLKEGKALFNFLKEKRVMYRVWLQLSKLARKSRAYY